MALAAATRASVFLEIGKHHDECLEGEEKHFTPF
jgi:hypothetical protein